jgi:hypothetical protein
MTSHTSHAVHQEYNYDIHSVKRGVAFFDVFWEASRTDATGHRLILSSTALTHSRLGERIASI